MTASRPRHHWLLWAGVVTLFAVAGSTKVAPAVTESPPPASPADIATTQHYRSAHGRLRKRVAAGWRDLLVTVFLAAVPAIIILTSWAAERVEGELLPAAYWEALVGVARIFKQSQDPMDTIGALAAITVAIIFYNAPAQLPEPGSGETSEAEEERMSTILRTKSILRVVAFTMAIICWCLVVGATIEIVAGVSNNQRLFDAIEVLALLTLIAVSCNFVTTQREEIQQRSLLALDAAHSAYTSKQQVRASASSDRLYLSLKRRLLLLLGLPLVAWAGYALWPPSYVAWEFTVFVGVLPIALVAGLLAAVGALQVPWRRSGPLSISVFFALCIALLCALIVTAASYAEVGPPPLKFQLILVSPLVLYVLAAVALWPVVEISARRSARSLRNFIRSREAPMTSKH